MNFIAVLWWDELEFHIVIFPVEWEDYSGSTRSNKYSFSKRKNICAKNVKDSSRKQEAEQNTVSATAL